MDKYEGCPTTRMYPRTMKDAFKDDIENSQWFYPPEKEPRSVVDMLLWSAGICLWVGLAYYFAKN